MIERSELSFNLEDSCPPLLTLCIKPMKAFELVRAHLKPVPLTLSSLANECFALHRALVKVQRFDLHSLDVLEKVHGEQVLDSLEAFFLGCDMTMTAVNERAEELRRQALVLSVSDGARSPTVSNPVPQHIWKEDEMKEFVVQIREYRSGLTDLLTEVWSDIDTSGKSCRTHDETVTVSEILSPQNSPQLRPSSIRSSDQGSLLDPSPPYAISLHEYVIDHAYPLPTTRLRTLDLGQNTMSDRGQKPLILQVNVIRARNLPTEGKFGTRNAFLVVKIGASKLSSSALDQKNLNPEWHCCLNVPLVGGTLLECVCWNFTKRRTDYVGEFDIAVEDIFSRGKVQQGPKWYRLIDSRRNGSKTKIQVSGEVMLSFSLVDSGNAAATPGEIYEKLQKLVGVERRDSCDTSTNRDRGQSHAENARDEVNAIDSSQPGTEPSGV